MIFPRHCEPTGPRFARPDDRLHEAIQKTCAAREGLECFVAALLAMTACGLNAVTGSYGALAPYGRGSARWRMTESTKASIRCSASCPARLSRLNWYSCGSGGA